MFYWTFDQDMLLFFNAYGDCPNANLNLLLPFFFILKIALVCHLEFFI